MNKKKIGELDGTPIVTGGKNYTNEHEYYMTLNGDNTYQKLEQRTNGDQFRLVLGSGDSTNPGYTVTKSYITIADETITTVNHGGYNDAEFSEAADIIIGETYKVTFNDTEYTCVAYDNYGDTALGALWDDNLQNYDYSTYPFNIYSYESDSILRTELRTESAGEYSVKIEHLEDVVETTEDFEKAVNSVVGYSTGVNIIMPDGYVLGIDSNNQEDGKAYNVYHDIQPGNIYFCATNDMYVTKLPFYLGENASYIIGSWIVENDGALERLSFTHLSDDDRVLINPSNAYHSGINIIQKGDEYHIYYKQGEVG